MFWLYIVLGAIGYLFIGSFFATLLKRYEGGTEQECSIVFLWPIEFSLMIVFIPIILLVKVFGILNDWIIEKIDKLWTEKNT